MNRHMFANTLLAIAAKIKEAGTKAQLNDLVDIEELSFEDVDVMIQAIVKTLAEKEINKLKILL